MGPEKGRCYVVVRHSSSSLDTLPVSNVHPGASQSTCRAILSHAICNSHASTGLVDGLSSRCPLIRMATRSSLTIRSAPIELQARAWQGAWCWSTATIGVIEG